MDGRKLALLACLAASCAGCVTETKSAPVFPETMSQMKGIKEAEFPKRDAHAMTWVAAGELHESKCADPKAGQADRGQWYNEARLSYQKAIETDPKCVEAHVRLAQLYMKQDDAERAMAVYQRATQQNPKAPVLYYEMGMLCAQRKDFANAVASLAKAHELDPDNRQVATHYGLCLARSGKPQEGVTVLSKVMNRADANYNVARMMKQVNQQDLSRQFVMAALEERPSHKGAQELVAELSGPPVGPRPAMANAPVMDTQVRRASLGGPQ